MEEHKHWATTLEVGDRVTATLRHKTDGTKNKHNVPVIVISVDEDKKCINGYTQFGKKEIPFDELKNNIKNG